VSALGPVGKGEPVNQQAAIARGGTGARLCTVVVAGPAGTIRRTIGAAKRKAAFTAPRYIVIDTGMPI
jgi:hypothetical protein